MKAYRHGDGFLFVEPSKKGGWEVRTNDGRRRIIFMSARPTRDEMQAYLDKWAHKRGLQAVELTEEEVRVYVSDSIQQARSRQNP